MRFNFTKNAEGIPCSAGSVSSSVILLQPKIPAISRKVNLVYSKEVSLIAVVPDGYVT